MATQPSIHAWEIPWTDEPGGLQSMALQRVRQRTTDPSPPLPEELGKMCAARPVFSFGLAPSRPGLFLSSCPLTEGRVFGEQDFNLVGLAAVFISHRPS